jgi:hypothetical protein
MATRRDIQNKIAPVVIDIMPRARTITPEVIAIVADDVMNGASYDTAMQRHGYTNREITDLYATCIPLQDAVIRARAEAKMNAEKKLFHTKPELWITRGPGRAQENEIPSFIEAAPAKVNVNTPEPLRVAHAHVHQHLPAPTGPKQIERAQLTQEDINQFLAMPEDERKKIIADLERDLDE